MFDKILKQFRDKICANRYVMTIHAEEFMDDDGLTIFDVERAILLPRHYMKLNGLNFTVTTLRGSVLLQ